MMLRILLLLLGIPASIRAGGTELFDVVVYGGTAGGVMAGIAASRQGAQVIILEPGRHVGGMVSGGLGRTDVDRQEKVIGGLSLEFFQRVGNHYSKKVAWTFEPSVAEKTLKGMLAEANVPVRFEQPLASVSMTQGVVEN